MKIWEYQIKYCDHDRNGPFSNLPELCYVKHYVDGSRECKLIMEIETNKDIKMRDLVRQIEAEVGGVTGGMYMPNH